LTKSSIDSEEPRVLRCGRSTERTGDEKNCAKGATAGLLIGLGGFSGLSGIAQVSQQSLEWCSGINNATVDQQIEGCTNLLQTLPIAFKNRGNALVEKRLLDRAIQGYEQGLRLTPNFAKLG
jgi:hypothetical protein